MCSYGHVIPRQAVETPSGGDLVPFLERRIGKCTGVKCGPLPSDRTRLTPSLQVTGELERQVHTLQQARLPQESTLTMFPESVWRAFIGTGGDPGQLVAFLLSDQTGTSSPQSASQLGEHSVEWRLARPALADALALHLITCQHNIPCFTCSSSPYRRDLRAVQALMTPAWVNSILLILLRLLARV